MRLHRSLTQKILIQKFNFWVGFLGQGTIEVSKSHVTDLNEFMSYWPIRVKAIFDQSLAYILTTFATLAYMTLKFRTHF